MTYYEYVKITKPENAYGNGFVRGCPHHHGLPPVVCDGLCTLCYAEHEVPEDMVRDLFMEPLSDDDLMKLVGGAI